MGTIQKKILVVCLVTICMLGQIVPCAAKTENVKKGNTIGNLDQRAGLSETEIGYIIYKLRSGIVIYIV